MKKTHFNLIAFALLVLLALSAPALAGSHGRVTTEELKAMLSSGEKVTLIDVRTPAENAEARIPGSILMPLGTLGTVEKLPGEGTRVVIYCRSGKRSQTALGILSGKGFTGLVDLDGGILAWQASGGKVESGPASK